ncbi:type II toxin-antitoxin system RelE/ParE family toxin, partial [Serratia marcescens]
MLKNQLCTVSNSIAAVFDVLAMHDIG